jgi:hypothetical protein
LWVALLFVCVTSSLVISRLFARRVFNKLRRDGRIRRPVIIVGTGSEAVSLLHATQRRPDLGYEVLGFTGDPSAAGAAPCSDRSTTRGRDPTDRCDRGHPVGGVARSLPPSTGSRGPSPMSAAT